MTTIIKIENLSKKYVIGHQRQESYSTLRDVMMHKIRGIGERLRHPLSPNREKTTLEEFWALKDINFEIKQGDRVGIIGRNGAGKSTLLKILSRITEPTTGRIKINGRVASLLEVGTGFHPELTGRENIFLNGAILGMSRVDIKKNFDEIVAFAEVEKFLDTPVKRYSSGMYVRLAFAVAAHLEPEILIVDEVLAVGDAAFQKKCLGKMGEVAEGGRTVLFVSHNMGAIQALCSRGIMLYNGVIRCEGPTTDVISAYLAITEIDSHINLRKRFDDKAPKSAWYTDIRFRSATGEIVTAAISGLPLDIILVYQAKKPGLKLDFAIGIYNSMGEKILHLGTFYSSQHSPKLPLSDEVICHIPKLPLPQGRYRINLSLHNKGERIDYIEGTAVLDVQSGDFYGTGRIPSAQDNKVLIDHSWQLPYDPIVEG